MAIVNGYTTLDTIKKRIAIDTTDTADDTELERIVTAVSRAIDNYCGRRFYAVVETRYYTARYGERLPVDDLLSITTLQTDHGDRSYQITWDTSDYDLCPANAALDGEPYWEIRTTLSGAYSFPIGVPRGVKITGSFGYSASTPPVVEDACLAQCKLEFDARHSASGMEGGGINPSTNVSLHPFVQRILDPLRRISVG